MQVKAVYRIIVPALVTVGGEVIEVEEQRHSFVVAVINAQVHIQQTFHLGVTASRVADGVCNEGS